MLLIPVSPIRILFAAVGIWAFARVLRDYRRRAADPRLIGSASTRWLRIRLGSALVMIGVIIALVFEFLFFANTVPLWLVSGPLVVAAIAAAVYLIASFAQGFSER